MKAVPVTTLDELVESGAVQLTRGKIISKRDIAACPGNFPIYSSAKDNDGKFGEYGMFLFDEELITWSVDGGGRLFHRPKHKFSVTNVGGVLRIRDTSILDYRYLYFVLTLRHSEISFDWVRKAHPSVIKKLYQNIPLPPLAEQQRIVGLLDEAFEGLATAKANAEKNLQNARALFESHLQSVFTQRGPGWVEKKLGEISEFKNGLNYNKSSGGQTLPVVGVADFQDNYFVPLSELQSATIDGNLADNYAIQPNDILTVRSNGSKHLIGRCMLVGDVDEVVSYSGFIIRIRFDAKTIFPQFLLHFMKCQVTRDILTAGGGGANINNINQEKLSTLLVPLPPYKTQIKLAAALDDMREETQRLARLYERKLAALEALKKSLLHQAFTGAL